MKPGTLTPRIAAGYQKLIDAATILKSPLLLLVRLYWGYQFFQTGKGHLENFDKTASFFKDLAIPFPAANAALAGTTECIGGLLLLIGLASRLSAIPLIITMIVAYFTADMDAVRAIYSDSDKFVSAAPFLFLFASVLILVFGPGKFSIDHLLARKFQKL